MSEFQDLWNKVREVLQKRLVPTTFENTFGEVKKVVGEENGVIYVLTPSNFIKHTINSAYYRNISDILEALSDKKYRLKFVTDDEIKPVEKKTTVEPLQTNNLNLNYTFESFVVGDSNRISYLTALKVADNPGFSFNPLYIFGGVGLGKTHLMHAIGNYIAEKNFDAKILYVQANDFLNDYSKASRINNFAAFDEKYEGIDVLLIDDIQMLTDRTATQQQFFKIFNEMDNHHSQIIITSDRPASKLNGFMDRLTSRFQTGVTVNIDQPDLPQRMNILQKKVTEITAINVDDDILQYIAENFTENVRELEGALNRVLLYAELYNTKPTLQLAKESLEVLIKAKKPQNSSNVNYEDALSIIANMYNISVYDICDKSRNAKHVLPRHITMYILKTRYNLTYKKIGDILNGRDHTTIMNGCNKIETEMKTNEELKMAIESIIKKL